MVSVNFSLATDGVKQSNTKIVKSDKFAKVEHKSLNIKQSISKSTISSKNKNINLTKKKVNSSVKKKTSISSKKKVNSSVKKKTSISSKKKVNSSTKKKTSISSKKKVNSSAKKKTSISSKKKVNSSAKKKIINSAKKKIINLEYIVIDEYNKSYEPRYVKYNSKELISKAKCSCGKKSYNKFYTTKFQNYCMCCKKSGQIVYRAHYEGEWTCKACGADYCLVTGKVKLSHSKKFLKKID
ncbi:MAG: hypothetical protein FWH54_02310 [Methanobrevibacter sp.]|nr:hypothetical protein [Methanobrevibacter sp.]